MPERIQRSRAKGWRMPPNAVQVSRPSKWGNPWRAENQPGVGWCCTDTRNGLIIPARDQADAHDLAVAHYRAWVASDPEVIQADLRGKDLCCWCQPGLACHADVLLEIANTPEPHEIDDRVDIWHRGLCPPGWSLADALGMTAAEYQAWARDPRQVPPRPLPTVPPNA
jgi:hypothetical protein